MPVTPAHAAVAWPLRAVFPSLPLVPLVAGALSPDFEYLVWLKPAGRNFHSLAGVLFVCLPASLAAVALFDHIVRPLVARRFPRTIGAPPAAGSGRWMPVVAAILAGAASHVLWDAFTHRSDFGVQAFPALLQPVSLPGGGSLPRYRLLQHASSVLGLALIAAWTWRWHRRLSESSRRAFRREARAAAPAIGLVLLIASACASMNGAVAAGTGLTYVLGRAAVGAMDGVILGVAFVAWRDARRARVAARLE